MKIQRKDIDNMLLDMFDEKCTDEMYNTIVKIHEKAIVNEFGKNALEEIPYEDQLDMIAGALLTNAIANTMAEAVMEAFPMNRQQRRAFERMVKNN